jgi:hypothetical protein
MADNPDALKTSPAQYLERAKIIRWQTETMSNADVCRQLLDIAGTRRRHRTVAPGVTEKRERAGPKPALPPQSPARGLGPAGNSLTRSPQQTVQTCASGAPKPGPVNPESARQPLPSGSHRPPALRRIPAVDRDKRAARQRRLSGSSRRVIGRLPRRLQMRQPPLPATGSRVGSTLERNRCIMLFQTGIDGRVFRQQGLDARRAGGAATRQQQGEAVMSAAERDPFALAHQDGDDAELVAA